MCTKYCVNLIISILNIHWNLSHHIKHLFLCIWFKCPLLSSTRQNSWMSEWSSWITECFQVWIWSWGAGYQFSPTVLHTSFTGSLVLKSGGFKQVKTVIAIKYIFGLNDCYQNHMCSSYSKLYDKQWVVFSV